MPLSCRLGHRQASTNTGVSIAMTTLYCGISSKSELHSPDYNQTPAIYSKHASFSFLVQHPNLLFPSSHSVNQSTSTAVDLFHPHFRSFHYCIRVPIEKSREHHTTLSHSTIDPETFTLTHFYSDTG